MGGVWYWGGEAGYMESVCQLAATKRRARADRERCAVGFWHGENGDAPCGRHEVHAEKLIVTESAIV